MKLYELLVYRLYTDPSVARKSTSHAVASALTFGIVSNILTIVFLLELIFDVTISSSELSMSLALLVFIVNTSLLVPNNQAEKLVKKVAAQLKETNEQTIKKSKIGMRYVILSCTIMCALLFVDSKTEKEFNRRADSLHRFNKDFTPAYKEEKDNMDAWIERNNPDSLKNK